MLRKYHNKKVTTTDGLKFDSQKEYRRYIELKMMETAALITDLQRQVKFELIPAQREPDKVGKRGGKIKGKLIEKECCYYADFTYFQDGEFVVEDVKGIRTDVYKIKRKLMLWKYGIKIHEI